MAEFPVSSGECTQTSTHVYSACAYTHVIYAAKHVHMHTDVYPHVQVCTGVRIPTCTGVYTHNIMYTLITHAYTYSHMHTVAMETAYYCVTDYLCHWNV